MSSIQTGVTPAYKIIVQAEKEVAFDSPDHLSPWGTRRDNSVNQRFNNKLYHLYPMGRFIRVLDLGCSGGGFVRNCVDDGCFAVGLEGSDYSRQHRRAEWRTIPEHLFTCDITRSFEIFLELNGQAAERAQFDVVTSWELMEHIPEPDLAMVAANVQRHLAPGGLWIMSVSPRPDIINGVNLHQTVQPRAWWIRKFAELGFENLPAYVRYFNTQWVRGPKYGYSDSFHLVLAQGQNQLPQIPHEGVLRRVYDRWLGSSPQKFLAGKF